MTQASNEVAHSHIGASSMHRWAECPGSVGLSKGLPNRSSKYAEEGTEAHEHAAYRLQRGYWKNEIDPEMQEAVQVYTTLIEYDRRDGQQLQSGVEHRFDLTSIYPGLFGTADAWIYHGDKKLLVVYDYKHGAGVPVDVKDNPQLMYYGLGALMSLNLPCDTVELVIVQPRCPHPDGAIRRWRFPAMQLVDFAADLADYAKKTEEPNAPLKAGDHCRFCPANAICPLMTNKAQSLAKAAFAPTPALNEPFNRAEFAKTLDWLPILEGWIKNVRDFAYGEAEHGRPIPGWKLVAKRASRKWIDEVKAGQYLDHEFPMTAREFYESSLKSPAQIEKVLHKNQHEKLTPLIVSISSGSTLVPESDPRPEVKRLDAKTEFETLELFS